MSLDISQLTTMVARDSAAISRLKDLLEQERELFETRKLDSLQAIVDEKTLLIDQLNQHAQIRQSILQRLNLPLTAEGWDLFLQRDSQTLGMRSDWKKITADFVECQKLNEINGKMIARSRQTLSQLLNLLRGQVAAPSLYTAKGNQAQASSSYTLAKA